MTVVSVVATAKQSDMCNITLQHERGPFVAKCWKSDGYKPGEEVLVDLRLAQSSDDDAGDVWAWRHVSTTPEIPLSIDPINSLATDPIAVYFLGSYLGTMNGVSYGFPVHKVAGGFEYLAGFAKQTNEAGDSVAPDQTKLVITKQREVTTTSSINTALREAVDSEGRVSSTIEQCRVTVQAAKTKIGQLEEEFRVQPEKTQIPAQIAATEQLRDQQQGFLNEAAEKQKAMLARITALKKDLESDTPITFTFDLTQFSN